jgi:hypothetical protein
MSALVSARLPAHPCTTVHSPLSSDAVGESHAFPDRLTAVRQARVAGACYLLVIAGGVFAALFVREPLFVPGDAAATASGIAASEALWRWGIAVHALYLLAGAAFAVILYGLFRAVEATLARLALVLMMSDVAIEAVLLTSLYVPLVMMEEAFALGALDEGQRHALGYLAVRLFLTGWSFGLLLFAGFCVAIGLLILRSRLVPRVIGVLMVAAGASYVVSSLVGIVSPPLLQSLLPWIFVPPFVGELSLALWLTVKGVRTMAPAVP